MWNKHYQKIDKYKQKYRENISVGKFLRDFTDGNIPSVYTEGITVGKKIKNDDVSFLPTELLTEFISSVKSVGKFICKLWTLFIMSITKEILDRIFRRYFPESSKTVHFPIALLIVVLYGQNHRRIEKSSVFLAVLWKKSINLKFYFKYYRRNHRRIEKSLVIVGGFWKLFTKLKI
jgi:hypothetical protein